MDIIDRLRNIPTNGIKPTTLDFAADEIERLRSQLEALRKAAQAVVDRWETPLWKDAEPTAKFIHALRDALK